MYDKGKIQITNSFLKSKIDLKENAAVSFLIYNKLMEDDNKTWLNRSVPKDESVQPLRCFQPFRRVDVNWGDVYIWTEKIYRSEPIRCVATNGSRNTKVPSLLHPISYDSFKRTKLKPKQHIYFNKMNSATGLYDGTQSNHSDHQMAGSENGSSMDGGKRRWN